MKNTLDSLNLTLENQNLIAALDDTVATLMVLSAKHQDGLGLLVATSVYNARKVLAEAREAAR
jgi:hypothetical protein